MASDCAQFAGDDFVQKVEGLLERSPEGSTIGQQIDKDVADGKAKEKGSVTRDVLRITRGLDFIRAFVEALLAADPAEESLVDPAWKAYEAELMPYHAWVVQTAVRAGIYTVPYRSTFLQVRETAVLSVTLRVCRMPPEIVSPLFTHLSLT